MKRMLVIAVVLGSVAWLVVWMREPQPVEPKPGIPDNLRYFKVYTVPEIGLSLTHYGTALDAISAPTNGTHLGYVWELTEYGERP